MFDQILIIVLDVLKVIVALIVLGLGTERGTQIVKELLRIIAVKVPWLDFKDKRSFLLAAAVAFTVTYFFGVDLTQWLPILDGFDQGLVDLVTALLTTLFSNKIHDLYFKAA